MSSHVFSRLVISCHAMSSCSRILLPNLSSEPSQFFYYGGGVATTRFSKPWPCAGIRLGATLSLWRRVHCERARVAPCTFLSRSRGRLRGSGVLEVCREHAAGVSRRCAVGIVFRACFVHAWPTCVSRGRLRGSCVLAAPCRGDWFRGVSRARMILHAVTCVSRGRCGTSDALMRSGRHWTVDPRGRRSESCAVAKIAGFRGPVRQIACAGARWALRRAAGCVGRVGRAALCRGTQWQAVTMGVGRVARVARAALCHEDCCWACRLGHGDCCWACRVGRAAPWGLLLGVSRECRCAMGIAGRAVLSVAPCLGDC